MTGSGGEEPEERLEGHGHVFILSYSRRADNMLFVTV